MWATNIFYLDLALDPEGYSQLDCTGLQVDTPNTYRKKDSMLFLTPLNRITLENLIIPQLIKKSLSFYGIPMSVTFFTTAPNLFLP
jgi:hypothetical protein